MTKKSILALLLVLTMCLSIFPSVAFAAEDVQPAPAEEEEEIVQNGEVEVVSEIAENGVISSVTYTVSFDANGGVETYDDQYVKAGEKVAAPADPTQDGYIFDGWYEKIVDEGNGAVYYSVYDFDLPVNGDLELVALWSSALSKEELNAALTVQKNSLKLGNAPMGSPGNEGTDVQSGDEANVGTGVAQIDNVKYETLAAAFASITDGTAKTIEVLANSTGAGIVVPSGRNITVNFNNHSYTVVEGPGAGSEGTQNQVFQLLQGSTIVFNDGVIAVGEENATLNTYYRVIQNYANLTLNNMEVKGDNLKTYSGFTNSVIESDNGVVALTGSTKIRDVTGGANPIKAVNVDAWNGSYPAGTQLTVNLGAGGEIGTIHCFTEGSGTAATSTLAIEAGTVGALTVAEGNTVAVTKAETASVAAPAGYKWVLNETTGKDELVAIVYVAQIGDVKYETLAAAIAAVPANTQTTITMIADETIVGNAGVTVAAGKIIVLDLNGFTVKNAVNENTTSQVITNNGILTIQDSSAAGTGLLMNAIQEGTQPGEWWSTPQYNYATNVIKNSGTLNVESGTIRQTAAGSICYAIDNNSTSYDSVVNIKGGTVTDDYGTVIRMFCNSATKKNEINISGGIVTTTGTAALWIQLPNSDATKAMKATLNVTGGTLHGGTYAFYDYTYGNSFDATQYTLSGGTFDGSIFSYGANIEIKGGTFNGDVAIKQANAPSNVSVSGGKFADDVYTYGEYASEGFITGGVFATKTYVYEGDTYDCDWMDLVNEDCCVVDNTDPATKDDYPYAVGKAVAQIGETKYTTLAAAIAAVPTDGTATTITMIADETVNVATGALTIAAGKNVVLELNGNTVTGYCESGTASALFTNNGTLTIQDATDTNKNGSGNGKIYAGANPAWIYEGGEDYSGSYASNMISNRGLLVIESGYLESTTSGSAAYIIDNYSNGNVTINGGYLYNYHTNAIRLFCNSATAENTVTVNGGIIKGYCPIWVQGASKSNEKGALIINGGEIYTTEKAVVNGTTAIEDGNSYLYMWPSNENMSMTITGGTFYTNVCAWGNGAFTISGGRFGGYVYSATQTGFISGGIYKVEPDADYIAYGLAAVENTDEATREDYPYMIGHVHTYEYNKPNWKWTVINGNWSATVSYPCVLGDAYEVVQAVVTKGDVDPQTSEVTYTATDSAHDKTDTKTVVETYTVSYNGGTQTFKYGTAFKAGEEGGTLYDWYVKEDGKTYDDEHPDGDLRAKGTSVFYLPVVANATVTKQESASQSDPQEPVANASATATVAPGATTGTVVYHVTWSLPEGAQITSEKIYRAVSTIGKEGITEDTVIEKGTQHDVNLNVRNGDYTLTLQNVKANKDMHLVLVIKYTLPGVSEIQTLKDYTVVTVQ